MSFKTALKAHYLAKMTVTSLTADSKKKFFFDSIVSWINCFYELQLQLLNQN
jgi:hypothetical protein